MANHFASHQAGLTSPAQGGFVITPADGTPLAHTPRAIYVGTSGSLSAVMLSGEAVVFSILQAGMIYPLRLTEVRATGTTAGGLIALY